MDRSCDSGNPCANHTTSSSPTAPPLAAAERAARRSRHFRRAQSSSAEVDPLRRRGWRRSADRTCLQAKSLKQHIYALELALCDVAHSMRRGTIPPAADRKPFPSQDVNLSKLLVNDLERSTQFGRLIPPRLVGTAVRSTQKAAVRPRIPVELSPDIGPYTAPHARTLSFGTMTIRSVVSGTVPIVELHRRPRHCIHPVYFSTLPNLRFSLSTVFLCRKTALERVAAFLLEIDHRLKAAQVLALPMCR